jgi:hypothetical protein
MNTMQQMQHPLGSLVENLADLQAIDLGSHFLTRKSLNAVLWVLEHREAGLLTGLTTFD